MGQRNFNVTFDSPSLYVGSRIFDVTTGTPVEVGSVTAMTNITGNNTYFGQFTPDPSKQYVIIKSVYTDVGHTTLDTNYYQGSESVNPDDAGGGGNASGCSVVGYVNCV